MRRRNPVFIAVACAAVMVVVVGVCLPAPEPRYEGRLLSFWLENPDNFIPEGFDPSAAGVQAVRAIGTNAIPTLLQWISYEPSPLRQKLRNLLQNLPGPLKPRNGQIEWLRATDAGIAFAILGSQAHAAVPELVHLALTSSDTNRAQRCIDSLFHIGPAALPGVFTIVTNTHAKKRLFAISRIHDLGTNAVSAVPVLLKCLEDNDDEVVQAAAATLSELALLPATTVPALKNALQSANARRRAFIIGGFYGFGAAAKPAVPQLQAALFDSSQDVRRCATNVLLHIAPEALTNVAPP